MCKIIDLASMMIKESKIYWQLTIDATSNERFGIMKNPANDEIMIFITTNSFDRIPLMREKALLELKQQILKMK